MSYECASLDRLLVVPLGYRLYVQRVKNSYHSGAILYRNGIVELLLLKFDEWY